MSYSRQEPSARYTALITMYRDMHLHGERFRGIPAMKTFDGRSLRKETGRIKNLIALTGARTILDYGSGKGQQYDPGPLKVKGEGEWEGVIDYWGVDEVICFDPAYLPYSELPTGTFDGVISTDVLEHCPEEDVPWIVEEMFSFADKFLFATVACYPANKRLPNGENAHCTIRPVAWWQELFARSAARRPGVAWEVWVTSRAEGEERLVEQCLAS